MNSETGKIIAPQPQPQPAPELRVPHPNQDPPVNDTPSMGITTVGAPKDLAGLFRKMATVLGAVERVTKGGENTQQGYRYTTEADLLDEIRPEMASAGIAFFPSVLRTQRIEGKTANNRPKTLARVTLQTAFCDADSGAMIISTWEGEAEDTGDKAFWKAYTGTLKYAHMKTWMVSTGDDPERDEGGERQGRRDQRRQRREVEPAAAEDIAAINRAMHHLPAKVSASVGSSDTLDLQHFIASNFGAIEGSARKARQVLDVLASREVQDQIQALAADPPPKPGPKPLATTTDGSTS